MKKYIYVILSTFVFACTQKPVEVVHKKGSVYNPKYSSVYVESPDGKIARSLRGHNNSDKAQKISIINKDTIKEINKRDYNYYTVKNGDSLWVISRKYDMKVPELVVLNNLRKPYNIKPGQKLRVAGISESNSVKVLKRGAYIVKSGDNLSTIASRVDMNMNELAKINNLKSPYRLRVGQKLVINSSKSSVSSNSKSSTGIYKVKSGDNLSSIASRYDMSLNQIASLNNLRRPYTLKIGQKLKINKNDVVVSKQVEKTHKKQTKKYDSNRKNLFGWPVKGKIVSNFGNKSDGSYNDGINIEAPKGTDFKASEDGVVAYVGNELRGYGTIILIKHNNNWISAYAHCQSVNVSRGDRVGKGQIIGTIGESGNVSKPQLYFSLRSGRKAVDPLTYLK